MTAGPAPDAREAERWLDECRARFGEPPRRIGLWAASTALWVPPPPWLRFEDDLSLFFHHRKELMRTGLVVWGHLVQANALLFEPGPLDRPAVAVFCPLPGGGPTLADLRRVAGAVSALKGQTGLRSDAALLAGHLADERSRPFGLPVPADISGRHLCELSTVFVARKHLPGRVLAAPHFPLLVHPGPPRVAMVLPARYWPADLVDQWARAAG